MDSGEATIIGACIAAGAVALGWIVKAISDWRGSSSTRSHETRKTRGTVYTSVLGMLRFIRAQINDIAGVEGDFGEQLNAPDLTEAQQAAIEADVTVYASQAVKTDFEYLMSRYRETQKWDWHRQDVQFFAEQEGPDAAARVRHYGEDEIKKGREDIRKIATRIEDTIRREMDG